MYRIRQAMYVSLASVYNSMLRLPCRAVKQFVLLKQGDGTIMKAAVRYYSRSGHTKAIAEAIAKPLGVPAISIDAQHPALSGPVDVLFIGGALYAYGIDKKLENYIQKLPRRGIKKAVVFSTSWISRHAIDLIKQALSDRGISVEEQ